MVSHGLSYEGFVLPLSKLGTTNYWIHIFLSPPLRATGDNLSHLNSLTTLIGTWCCVQWLHHLSIELIPKATEINSSYMSHPLMVKSMWYVFVSMFLTITAALSGVVRLAVLRLQPSGWWTPHRFMTSLSFCIGHSSTGQLVWSAGVWGRGGGSVMIFSVSFRYTRAQITCIHCQLERCMHNVILLRRNSVAMVTNVVLDIELHIILRNACLSAADFNTESISEWEQIRYAGFLGNRSNDCNMFSQICPFSGNYPLTA